MSKTRVKLVIWAFLLLAATATGWGMVSGAANLLASFERGADPASALNIVPNVPPDLYVERSWLADAPDPGRQLAPVERAQVEGAYLRAWLQWNLSYLKGEPHGLKTYFTGPALEAASNAVRDATASGLRIEQADTAHQLRLNFYSADGAILSLTDRAALVAQVIRDAAGAVVYVGETSADYDVVLFLEDGNWRVRHWVRREAGEQPSTLVGQPCHSCVAVAQTPQGPALVVGGKPFAIAGVNYYPRETPWERFWPEYDPATIDHDLARIKGLGLNTVRIFVPYAQFGAANVSPVMLGRLQDLLDRADVWGLKVVPTLFDFRAGYDLLHWPDADRHLEALLTRFAAHPAILAWDLKNEPDLDDRRVGRETVDAWLAHVAAQARRYDTNHLLTIGWATPQAATRLADNVDLVQFHYYALAHDLPEAYGVLRAATPSKPVFMGEFGLPTWNSVFPHGHTEAEQAVYYAELLTALRQTDSVGALAWTLYDYPAVPATVAGRWPWQTGPQRHMGVLRSDESAKPAAALLAPDAPLSAPSLPVWARFLKPFWLLLLGALLVGGATGVWLLRRGWRRWRARRLRVQ